jgi:thiopeptide-type bacteriocin biosynthesis protein
MAQAEHDEAAAITRVGAERWFSVHIHDEAGTRDALLTVVPAVLHHLHHEGSIDSFFFVRYRDERGPHVRLRLRLLAATADTCWECIHSAAGGRFAVARAPYEPEVERYGGCEALPHSLSFFAISSAHALVFEREFGGLPRSRQLPLTLCVLLWQAWGLAADESDFRALLGYYTLGQELFPEMAKLAEETFQRSGEKLTGLIHRELLRLTAAPHDADEELPILASAGSLVTAARALSDAVGDLAPQARWSVVSSQMHMAANRLGLTNLQETFTAGVLTRAAAAVAVSDAALWGRLGGALERRRNAAAGAAALWSQVRSHLAALLETA